MNPLFPKMSLAVAISILSAGAVPSVLFADEPTQHDHTHSATTSGEKLDSSAATQTMQQMQTMHEKMMAAKTPAERQALMADHMKAMQQGMTMLQQMNSQSGKSAMSSQMMQMRMDMMTMMMQMMMDQQQMSGMPMGTTPSAPPAPTPPK